MSIQAIARRLSVLLLLLLATACVSGPRISSEADPAADFARYRSFAFYTPLAVEKKGYETFGSRRMKAAVRREMEARGYTYDQGAPDLWVNINAFVRERTDVVGSPYMGYGGFGGYYGYRGGAYFAPGFWGDYAHVHEYREGTLNVDLVDAREKRLVWEGIAVGRLSNMKPDERGARVDATIAEIYAAFPHRAGAPAP